MHEIDAIYKLEAQISSLEKKVIGHLAIKNPSNATKKSFYFVVHLRELTTIWNARLHHNRERIAHNY